MVATMAEVGHQEQGLAVDVEGVGRDGGEEALEDAQLDALIRDVIAAAQQLHRLSLRRQNIDGSGASANRAYKSSTHPDDAQRCNSQRAT